MRLPYVLTQETTTTTTTTTATRTTVRTVLTLRDIWPPRVDLQFRPQDSEFCVDS